MRLGEEGYDGHYFKTNDLYLNRDIRPSCRFACMNNTAGRCALGARVRFNTLMLWYIWFAPPYIRLFFVFGAQRYHIFHRKIMRAKRHIKQGYTYSCLVNAHQDNLFLNDWPWGASEWRNCLAERQNTLRSSENKYVRKSMSQISLQFKE